MAGGVNPFGFSMGVLPAARAPRQQKDLPSAPFGFAPPPSKWEQTKDILAPYVTGPYNAITGLMSADLNTLLYDTGPKGREAVENSFNLAGNLAGASSVVPKPRNALNMGIKAYHGSPHDFDAFDMSKIGTGEGAQAYGHGLYFADSEGVARSYRDTLTKSSTDGAQRRLNKAGGDVDAAIADVQSRIDNYRANGAPQYADAIEEDLRALRKFKETGDWSPGRMYEVNINADPDAFLDWDKPLSEQSEAVRAALANPSIPPVSSMLGGMRGKSYADPSVAPYFKGADLVQSWGTSEAKNATDSLKQAGIPGIKYLDAGSRPTRSVAQIKDQLAFLENEIVNTPSSVPNRDKLVASFVLERDKLANELRRAESGTRNYVVFDDKLISIVKKYGIAGASAMLGYNILDGMDPAQAEELQRIEGNQ